MDRSKLNIAQLRRRDPVAWSALLQRQPGLEDVMVTAVTASHVPYGSLANENRSRVIRYHLALAGCSDAITLIGKQTTRTEALFYRYLAERLPRLAPRCWFVELGGDRGWLVLDDVPDHFPPEKFSPGAVEEIVGHLADLHAGYWEQTHLLSDQDWLPNVGCRTRMSWELLRSEHAAYFEEGPAAVISEHALDQAGSLAPVLLKAANGLVVMRDLGGWPGVLGESHLSAVADLLDDPIPMLEPLRNLPPTLLHGDPHPYHWHLTLFGELRLLDWRAVSLGPGVYDLICFLERFDLLLGREMSSARQMRAERPATEETIIDSYMLAMSSRLGRSFRARDVRQAIPAARCLYLLTTWFAYFSTWFDSMPGKYAWQKINRLSQKQPADSPLQPLVQIQPYLAVVFQRFLQAFRSL